ncbi:MAG: bacterioferritin [Bryobacterales bacterium]|nr:bacterioferritin [Acidobacteriota bacterium]MCB9384253.1 bacterioferritin [Bryobacterales bacterium]
MKGNPKIIERLNETLRAEFTAIHQYFIHAEMQENWGYGKLGDFIKKQSIDEMKHAEKLIERILYLDGVPDMGSLNPMKVGTDVKSQLEYDLELEVEAVGQLNSAIEDAIAAKDNGSRELFALILVDEEEHIDWLEAQMQAIEDMGLGTYLSQQLKVGE